MRKYEFAYAKELGRIIHIDDVTEDMRSQTQFFCNLSDCNGKMAAHISGKRIKHFQHIKHVEHDYETYLHETAKNVFMEMYKNCLLKNIPFTMEFYENRICNAYYIETKIKCQLGKQKNTFDLTKRYTHIEMEKDHNGFRPDLIIYNPKTNDYIFIEIFVTHECESKKLDSGIRIIEIKIENEDDIRSLEKCYLSLNNSKIKFHNFKLITVENDFCKDRNKGCMCFYDIYVLLKSGNFFFDFGRLNEILIKLRYEYIDVQEFYIKYHPTHNGATLLSLKSKIRDFAYILSQKGILLKDCYLCKNHSPTERESHREWLFCREKMKPFKPDQALTCQSFDSITNSVEDYYFDKRKHTC